MPSASALKGLHLPSGARAPCRLKARNGPGVGMTATPPTMACLHSPWRNDRAARWRATIAPDEAVSTVMAGPRSPSWKASRPEFTPAEVPVCRWPSAPPSAFAVPGPYWWFSEPMNTPTALPCTRVGSTPTRSSRCHASSSRSLCCGCIASASRGEIPKKSASNPATSSRKPPRRT